MSPRLVSRGIASRAAGSAPASVPAAVAVTASRNSRRFMLASLSRALLKREQGPRRGTGILAAQRPGSGLHPALALHGPDHRRKILLLAGGRLPDALGGADVACRRRRGHRHGQFVSRVPDELVILVHQPQREL